MIYMLNAGQISMKFLRHIGGVCHGFVDKTIQRVGGGIEQLVFADHFKSMDTFAADVPSLAPGQFAAQFMMMGSGAGGGRDQITQSGQMQW